MPHRLFNPLFASIGCAVLALSPHAVQAQQVFKCTVNGRTAYQSEPCAGSGKELAIAAGPSASEVAEARAKAAEQRSRVTTTVDAPRSTLPLAAGRARPKENCDALAVQLGRANASRMATIRESRRTNVDQSASVQYDMSEMSRIRGRMLQAGCPPV